MYGKKHSDESKEKMKFLKNVISKSEYYSGDKNPFYNKHHSEETKQKISNKNKGKKLRTKLSVEQVKEIKKELFNKSEKITYNELYALLGKNMM